MLTSIGPHKGSWLSLINDLSGQVLGVYKKMFIHSRVYCTVYQDYSYLRFPYCLYQLGIIQIQNLEISFEIILRELK